MVSRSRRQVSSSTDEPELPEESPGMSPSKKLSLHSKTTEPSLSYQGPTKERQCTDLLCFSIFMLVIAAWLSIGMHVFWKTDKQFGLKPIDSFGNSCGQGKFRDRPNVFFFNLLECGLSLPNLVISGCSQTTHVCVANCPNVTFGVRDQLKLKPVKWLSATQRNASWVDYVICQYHIKPTLQNIEKLVSEKYCASIYFASAPMLGRCIPTIIKLNRSNVIDELSHKTMHTDDNRFITLDNVTKSASGLNNLFTANIFNYFQYVFEDLSNTWRGILIVIFGGVVLSILWMYFLHYFARLIIWTSLLLLVAILGYMAYFSIDRHISLSHSKNGTAFHVNSTDNNAAAFSAGGNIWAPLVPQPGDAVELSLYYFREALKNQLDNELSKPRIWLILSIIFSLSFALVLFLALVLTSRINLAIDLIRETSRSMSTLRCVILFPLVPYLLQVAVIILWLTIAVIIFGAGRRTFRTPDLKECEPENTVSNGSSTDCTLRQLLDSQLVLYAQGYGLFAFLWLLQFVQGCYVMTLAGSFSYYYWNVDIDSLPACTCLKSLKTTLRYHLGTVAFGSFFIALLRTLQWIIEFVYNKLKSSLNSDEPGMFTSIAWLARCLQAFLYFLEKLMTYINQNAFIMTAIYGKEYCSAAVKAFSLLLSNKLRALILYTISLYLMLVSKLCVSFLTGVGAYYFFQGKLPFFEEFTNIHFIWTPVLATMLITFMITDLYLGIYEIGLDTMFLCFLLDEKIHDGTEKSPFFMRSSVRKRILQLDRRGSRGSTSY